MSGIENYPTLQVIISILLIIVSVLIMITSIIIRKKLKLETIFCVTIFSIGILTCTSNIVLMLKGILELMLRSWFQYPKGG